MEEEDLRRMALGLRNREKKVVTMEETTALEEDGKTRRRTATKKKKKMKTKTKTETKTNKTKKTNAKTTTTTTKAKPKPRKRQKKTVEHEDDDEDEEGENGRDTDEEEEAADMEEEQDGDGMEEEDDEEEDEEGDEEDDWNEDKRRSYRGLGRKRVRYEEVDERDGDEQYEKELYRKRMERKRLCGTAVPLLSMDDENEVMQLGKELERVVDHRRISAGAMETTSSSPPRDDKMGDDEIAEEQEVLVKWKRMSYLHLEWVPVKNLQGEKKLVNYFRTVRMRQEEAAAFAGEDNDEEAEQVALEVEMEREVLEQYKQVERVVAQREVQLEDEDGDVSVKLQYLVKFKGLPYAECTWEDAVFMRGENVTGANEAIEDFEIRESRIGRGQKQPEEARKQFVRGGRGAMDAQPECLSGGGTLRDYQLAGLNWMMLGWSRRRNVILADEMGLGKTCQSISLVAYLSLALNVAGPYLVVVPLSVITNWLSEFSKWAKQLNVVVYVGDAQSREVIRSYEFHGGGVGGSAKNRKYRFDVLLTTYDIMLKDADVFSGVRWTYMVLDEAHRLKNSNSKVYDALMELRTERRLLITGTPLQNELRELWALLHFCEPLKFPDCEEFEEMYAVGNTGATTAALANTSSNARTASSPSAATHGRAGGDGDAVGATDAAAVSDGCAADDVPVDNDDDDGGGTKEQDGDGGGDARDGAATEGHRDEGDVGVGDASGPESGSATQEERQKKKEDEDGSRLKGLHRVLRPYLLRRVVKDVERSLPPKTERILRVSMSPLQRQYYRWILKKNVRELNKGASGAGQVSLLNIVVELQKCCNHPFLFQSADLGYRGGPQQPTDEGSTGASELDKMVLGSGKMTVLDKLLTRLKATGHRVLIFSQMVRMLDVIAEYLAMKRFQFQRLDGRTPSRERQHAMDHFNAPGSLDFCFLLSTRAGGLGVNLATADTVIIFDSDWNPKNDLQAIARAHRIGQKDAVNIYRFVTKDSVEENILERAKQKMVLDHLVIQRMDTSGRTVVGGNKKKMFDKKELAAILRFGAEGLFKDEGEKKGAAGAGTGNGAGASGEDDEKLDDLDVLLSRAERVDAGDGDQGAGAELLGAFKVAELDDGNETDAAFWKRLITVEEEENKFEELLPRAARLQGPTTYDEKDLVNNIDNTYREAPKASGRKEGGRKGGGTGGSGEGGGRDDTGAKKESGGRSREKKEKPVVGAHARIVEVLEKVEGGGVQGTESVRFSDANAVRRCVMRFGRAAVLGERLRSEAGTACSATDDVLRRIAEALITGCYLAESRFREQSAPPPPPSKQDKLEASDAAAAAAPATCPPPVAEQPKQEEPVAPKKQEEAEASEPKQGDAHTEAAGTGAAASAAVTDGAGGTPAPLTVGVLDFFGYAVKSAHVIQRVEAFDVLTKRLTACADPLVDFSVTELPTRAPPWGVAARWSTRRDALLLIAVYRHGLGGWQDARNDTELRLDPEREEGEMPKDQQLDTRAHRLLTDLADLEAAKARGKVGVAGKNASGGGNVAPAPVKVRAALTVLGGASVAMKPAKPQLKLMRDLAKNTRLSNAEVLERMKRYILNIGDRAAKVLRTAIPEAEREESRQKLWNYVASYNAKLSEEQLFAMYTRLATKREAQRKAMFETTAGGQNENANTNTNGATTTSHVVDASKTLMQRAPAPAPSPSKKRDAAPPTPAESPAKKAHKQSEISSFFSKLPKRDVKDEVNEQKPAPPPPSLFSLS